MGCRDDGMWLLTLFLLRLFETIIFAQGLYGRNAVVIAVISLYCIEVVVCKYWQFSLRMSSPVAGR